MSFIYTPYQYHWLAACYTVSVHSTGMVDAHGFLPLTYGHPLAPPAICHCNQLVSLVSHDDDDDDEKRLFWKIFNDDFQNNYDDDDYW